MVKNSSVAEVNFKHKKSSLRMSKIFGKIRNSDHNGINDIEELGPTLRLTNYGQKIGCPESNSLNSSTYLTLHKK